MIARDQRPEYRRLLDDIKARLEREQFPLIVPETLAPNLHADASHPLTDGYAVPASQIYQEAVFQK